MPAPQTQREFALDVLRRLRDAGYEALWAGGCVRDQLLGREPKDYDVATNARPEAVQDLFGRRRTRAIGASFGVISVQGPKRLTPVEVATFRTDGVYADGRRPETVTFTDAEHDAQRRDLTINGLFFDPIANRVVDYVGGLADIEAKIVRAIGDPHRRFTEDKLRMLRAIRFTATYGFSLDEATLAAIRAMADEIRVVSYERIAAELRRMLAHSTRAHSIELLGKSELSRPLLPEAAEQAAAGDAAWQASLSRLRALGDVEFPLALAAWFLGLLDAEATVRVGRRWKLSNREIERASWLVRNAPTMLNAADAPWPRLQRLLAHDGGADLVALAAASLPADDAGLARVRASMAQPASVWNPPPLVTGDDLIAAGIRAGRHFATLLDHLRDEQLEGRLTTRDAALAAARNWIAAQAS
jgi:tRNA nucleotidyltransferase/poly(A) polymerase